MRYIRVSRSTLQLIFRIYPAMLLYIRITEDTERESYILHVTPFGLGTGRLSGPRKIESDPEPMFIQCARCEERAPRPPAPSSSFIVWLPPCGVHRQPILRPLSGWFSLTVCTIYFLLLFNLYLGMCFY